MEISDEEIETVRQLYREECEVDLTPEETRAAIHRALMLFERFAGWLARERAEGRHPDVE